MSSKPKDPPPEPPDGLTEAQRQLWCALAAEHTDIFTATDVVTLRAVVDVAGRLAEVSARLDLDGLIVEGSMKQPRANPLIDAETKLRGELSQRLREWRPYERW